MIFEILIAAMIGIIAGTITGLLPGIHINLVSAALIASLGYFSFISPISLAAFVVAMATTHTFLDFIPSVFLGAPDEDSFLSVLPGHKMLKEGKGHEAVVTTFLGSLASIPVILVFSMLIIFFLDKIYSSITFLIPFILVFFSLYIILRDENILLSLSIFSMAGFLGFFTLNLPVKEPLLPMLSGLFGISSLILSIKNKSKIPNQRIFKLSEAKHLLRGKLKPFIAASIISPFCSFLPGIGSGHAASFGAEIIKEEENKSNFLFLVGMTGTIVMALSFATVYAISRARSGAAATIQTILQEISRTDFLIMIATIVFSSLIAFVLGIKISEIFAKKISEIKYSKISIAVITFVAILNIFLSNWLGGIVLITSTALGVFAQVSNVRRINLMACLLVPTIIFYLT